MTKSDLEKLEEQTFSFIKEAEDKILQKKMALVLAAKKLFVSQLQDRISKAVSVHVSKKTGKAWYVFKSKSFPLPHSVEMDKKRIPQYKGRRAYIGEETFLTDLHSFIRDKHSYEGHRCVPGYSVSSSYCATPDDAIEFYEDEVIVRKRHSLYIEYSYSSFCMIYPSCYDVTEKLGSNIKMIQDIITDRS